ncbi:helix-turn-helix domain-containing protein [Ramlibacter sp. USB13]|uniref:Helix-turn-helix domain-containing protein n=1 Tax=Ramlibacter cellulosilyticus TaxID=2764187 RepID=A0A923MRT2_9BURK|nr:helix-turn-helix domain-containing protein [Ramlibacter cellulosilyticus]MBC5783786.1 helix-turn-helix domain-containing protein [Ramlibacter cellulosilyticus]
MSNAVTNRCRDAVLPPPAKAVLMCLADRADDLGVCWPAQSYISRWTCYGRTAVISAVRCLEENGLITVSRQNGRGNRTTINLVAVDAYILQQSTTSTPQQPVVPADVEQFASRTTHISEAHRTSPPGAHKTSGSSYIKKDRKPISAEWSPTTELLAWARSGRPDLAIELVVEVFRNHYLAAGDAKADWDACFRTWVLRERIQGTSPSPKPCSASASNGRDPALVKIETDWARAAPQPSLVREQLKELRNSFARASGGGRR